MGMVNPSDPVGIFVVDLTSISGKTSVTAALNLLKANGIKVAIEDPLRKGFDLFMIHFLRFSKYDPSLVNYESHYQTQRQVGAKGKRGVVSANFVLASSADPAADIIFKDPVFGNFSRN